MKKWLSVLLATVLLLTVMPLSALGVSAEDSVYNGMTYTITDGEVTITGYTNEIPEYLRIPENIENHPVTTISLKAFKSCSILKTVTIPDSVTNIERDVFNDCCALLSVTLPNKITTIEEYMFFRCSSLKSVTIPQSVTAICPYAFTYCDALANIYYGGTRADVSNIKIYSGNSFPTNAIWHYTKNGLRYNFVENEVVISGYDSNLPSDLIIPETIEGYPVTRIGKSAFSSCSILTSVEIPGTVVTIDNGAFSSCGNLTTVYINSGTKTIGNSTFEFCRKLTTIFIPKTLTRIDDFGFWQSPYIEAVYYEGDQKSNISFGEYGELIYNRNWYYNCSIPKRLYNANVTHSVMETDNGNGLAFRFELAAKGVVKDAKNVVDLSGATVNYLGVDCKLIGMGAIVTNNDAEAVNLTLDTVNNFNVVDIPTVYLQEANEDSCAFATRITNIPVDQPNRTIYARPYYIVEVDGEQITVYGDIDSTTCAEHL